MPSAIVDKVGIEAKDKIGITSEESGQLFPLKGYLACDVASALSASFLVSPAITIIDRGIIQNASGAVKMGDSVIAGFKEVVTKPHNLLRRPEFLMIWGVYASTYITANFVNTIFEYNEKDSAVPRFFGTTAVNMTTCIMKDRSFTRMFGTAKPHPLPIPTYLLFTVRDAGTVLASFNLPMPVSNWMNREFQVEQSTAEVVAQMVCPAMVQVFTTPLHLLGLDLYNSPKSSYLQRFNFVKREYINSVMARVARIGPAFGIGGISNTAFRRRFRSLVN